MTQLSMFSPPPAARPRAVTGKRASIGQRWEDFLLANPHVMDEMLRLARARLSRGATRIGAKALWEELRESLRVQKLGDWKLDNSLTALASRRLIELEPKLEGVIELRKRKAK
jgi:hypothetical protein